MNNFKPVVVVDVDETVVGMCDAWHRHLNSLVSDEFRVPYEAVKGVYDFSKYYPMLTERELMSFWASESCYDDAAPFRGAVNAVSEFRAAGADVVFVSFVVGDHFDSEHRFLKRFFEFDGFIGIPYTCKGAKRFVGCDIIIDDRNENLIDLHTNGVDAIRFNSTFAQTIDANVPVVDDWFECKELVLSLIRNRIDAKRGFRSGIDFSMLGDD